MKNNADAIIFHTAICFRVKQIALMADEKLHSQLSHRLFATSCSEMGNVMETLEIALDENGNKVVVLPDIIFSNKQNIDWNEVEKYLERFVGELVEIAETGDIIYLGKDFPDEYAGSKYTRKMKGGRAKAKANAAQGIREMVGIASDKRFRENRKGKHSGDAANGWYYYTTRFAMPVYDNEVKTENYNIYSDCLVVNCTGKGKMYLYDLVDIKKEASNPLRTNG